MLRHLFLITREDCLHAGNLGERYTSDEGNTYCTRAVLNRVKGDAARGATVEVKITGYGDPVAWAGLVEQEENAWSEEDFEHTLQHFAKGVLTLLKRSSLHFSDLDVAQKMYVTYELAGDLLDLTQMPE